MKEELAINKEKLGINDWLELIKEDKNLNGGYISISQYIWLLELENKQLKERVDYLERSNNRREDTILEQRQEISNLEDTYCDRTDCSSRIKDSKKYDSLKQKYDKQVDNWNKLKADLELVVDYCFGDEASRWDKIYGEHAKTTLNYMRELEQGSDSNVKDSDGKD